MKTIILNVLAVVLFASGITGLFVCESTCTRIEKEKFQKASEGHKSMY